MNNHLVVLFSIFILDLINQIHSRKIPYILHKFTVQKNRCDIPMSRMMRLISMSHLTAVQEGGIIICGETV